MNETVFNKYNRYNRYTYKYNRYTKHIKSHKNFTRAQIRQDIKCIYSTTFISKKINELIQATSPLINTPEAPSLILVQIGTNKSSLILDMTGGTV